MNDGFWYDGDVNVNSLSDLLPVTERALERALALCMIVFPHQTLCEILETRIEPSLDPQVTPFWGKVKPRIPEILSVGKNESSELIYSLMPRSLFWRCFSSYEDIGRPTEVKAILTDLIAVRSLRRSWDYLKKQRVIDRVFDGWAEL